LRSAHVLLRVARRNHRVGAARAGEGALQERGVRDITYGNFRTGPGERCQ
jgi:hypothetical protein